MPYEVNIYVNPSYDEISNTNITELCCEYLSVRCIRLYVRIMLHACGFTLKRVRDMIQA